MKRMSVPAVFATVLLSGCSPPQPGGGPGATAGTAPPAVDAATEQWAALAKWPDWSGVWEIDWRNSRGTPPRPQMKLTPEWQAKVDEYRAAQARGENVQTQNANCVPPGLPGTMSQPYPIEFLYQPGRIVMILEAFMQFRQIWMDGREHQEDPDLTFYGDSIGRWDGDTLVIDTIGLNPQNRIGPGIGHSDQLHVVERIRRVDDWLEIETTLTDPEVLAEPYTSTTSYRHLDDQLREYICLENNRDGADEQGRSTIRLE
jgi:hypothetical protein